MLPQQPRTQPEPLFNLNLDSNAAAKQMAALNAASMQRQLTNSYPRSQPPPSTSIPRSNPAYPYAHAQQPMMDPPQFSAQPSFPPASLDNSIPSSAVPPRHPVIKQKQRFLSNLASVHLNRGTPLPPALTGIHTPNYDPASSQWKSLECSIEGAFRLVGKDVDLFKLWGIVTQLGGGQKVTQQNAWPQLLSHFDLPEYLPVPTSNSQRATAPTLANYYNAIIHPFDEVYRRSFQDTNRKPAMPAGRPPGAPVVQNNHQPQSSALPASSQPSNMIQSVSGGQNTSVSISGSPTASASQALPQSPVPNASLSGTHGFSDALTAHSLPLSNTTVTAGSAGNENHDQDASGTKRRFESEELDGKRAKLKIGGTESPDASSSMPPSADRPQNQPTPAPTVPSRPRSQFTRTKIEYIPLAREVDTYGGRDLNMLEDEYVRAQRRSMRDINEWGTVDIEALTMSIRSRLTVEISYALTTFSLLSTMKGPTPGSGFPVAQCADLLEEVLDLLEDEAFDGVPDTPPYCLTEDTHIPRHRELVNLALETESLPFAGLKSELNSQKTDHGPRQRSNHVILAVTNIIRNLSVIQDNMQFLARHDRTLELILRICRVIVPREGGPPKSISPALSICDVISIRKDALHILSNLIISFPQSTTPSESTVRICTRIFELVASVLIEPADAIPPTQTLKLAGGIPFHKCKPPSLSDLALHVFTHTAHMDHNRQIFSLVIPQQWLWRLLETLVYRLPVSDSDFAFLTRESWLSYLEKATMAIYAIAFLSPPELKKKIRSDRSLHFSQVMLRMAQRFAATNGPPDARHWFMCTARRAIEAMKEIDGGEDPFDTSQQTLPTLAFGMGFGESGETNVEKGMGMLAGRRDVAWELLMHRDVDQTMFAELESLMRVE